jgi:ankyrin repeat protein
MRGERLFSAMFGVITLCAVVFAQDDSTKSNLLVAIRQGDPTVVRTLLKRGVDPNTRDGIGATALMHAAAFGSRESLRVLLDGGAGVNASSNGGGTALIWATADAEKIRLLLERGADARASTKDGTTALIAATRRGNLDVMRLLIARGAEPKSNGPERAELLRLAYGEHPETRDLLASVGVDLKSLAQSGLPSLAGYSVSNSTALETLLNVTADPNPRGRFPILASAAFQGFPSTTRLLLERGADPNARGQRGVTPLMMAAGATHPDPGIVRLLIAKGADIAARDQSGRSALDWALLQGENEVTRILRDAGTRVTPLMPPPAPGQESRTTRAALMAAVARLQPISPVLFENRKCIACHHQALPLAAMSIASARGIPVDREAMAHPARSIVHTWNSRREDLMIGREVAGGANELTYGLLALADAGVPSNSATDAAVANLLAIQHVDGSWVFLDTRPPQADNSLIHFTAMAVRGLEVYGPPAMRGEIETRVIRARDFLRKTLPRSTQDEVFKLLGLVWSQASAGEISAQRARVAALQRADGGWAQMTAMGPDAYATGQALHALKTSGMPVTDSVYQRGVTYLLRTQLEDGTWFVRSRAFGFQPYFESGFPHGVDQFISASATAWAAIALAHAL